MPKVCERKCEKSNSQEFEDDAYSCNLCEGPLISLKIEGDSGNNRKENTAEPAAKLVSYQAAAKGIGRHEIPLYQIEEIDTKIIQQFSHELVNAPELVFDITSNNKGLRDFPFVSDIDSVCQNCFTIQFYTIVLVDVWHKTDAVCLKIGTNKFSNFEMHHCCFLPVREVKLTMDNKETDFFLITGCIRIPKKFISSNTLDFPYKYFFFNKDGTGVYEDLHHQSNKDYNRHFYRGNISESDTKTVRQFDMMIIPRCTDIFSSVGSLIQRIPYWKGDSISFKDFIDRIFISLLTFLPTFMDFGYFPDRLECTNLDNFIQILIERLELLLQLKISLPKTPNNPTSWNTTNYIHQTGKPLLLQRFIKYLFQRCVKFNLQEIVMRIYLATILHNRFQLKIVEIISVVTDTLDKNISKILSAKSDLECVVSNTCYLHDGILDMLRCPQLHVKNYFQLLALYHMLYFPIKKHTECLNKLDYNDLHYWGIPVGLVIPKNRISKEEIDNALQLSTYDPILSYSVAVIALDMSNLEIFYKKHKELPIILPLSAFISLLLYKITGGKLKIDLLMTIVEFLNSRFSQAKISQIDSVEVECIFELSLKLSTQLSLPNQVTINQKDFFSLLKLLALECNNVHSITNENINSILEFFQIWYKRNFKSQVSERDFEKELNFFDDILKIQFPASVQWIKEVRSLLKNRLNQTDLKSFFTKLFITVHRKFSDELKELFNDKMIDILKKSNVKEKQNFLNKLMTLTPEQLKSISSVFCSTLLLERERFVQNKLRHLVEWSPWRNYFELATIKGIFESMEEKAKTLLDEALKEFSELIHSICTYQIKTCESVLYSERQDLIISLAELISKKKDAHSIEELGLAIKYCYSATDWIENQHMLIEYLQELFSKIEEFKFKFIEDILNKDLWNNFTIAQLVEMNDENYRFIGSTATNIEPLIHYKHFFPMSTSARYFKDSFIFISIFRKTFLGSECHKQVPTLDILFNNIWAPTIEQVERILTTSRDQTILLSDVQNYFQTETVCESSRNELKLMYLGIQHAKSENVNNGFKGYEECCENIAFYFELYELSEAATMLVKLKNSFSIETEFKLIEDIQNVKANFIQKPLSIINLEFKELIKSLRVFTPDNIKVLRSILEEPNISFINWANTNLKDLIELKTFVEIALATSNEAASETDRIMILNSVCTNLAPLIFGIHKGIKYDDLIERCRKILSEVKSNNKLLEQLKHVSNYNKYWTFLKTSQGSLEEGSLVKLNSIASTGVFTVTAKESRIPSEMVSLVSKKDNVEETYNMEQLTDLRSKLTLIVSKSNSKYRPNIQETSEKAEIMANTCTFNYLCDTFSEFANIISSLVEIGMISYFEYTFSCNFKEDHKKIKTEMQRTRKDLAKRKRDIEEAREKFFFLNYYTISQIVILQKGLLSHIDSNNKSQEHIYHLLGLLNADVTSDQIELARQRSGITGIGTISYSFSGDQIFDATKQDFDKSQNIRKPDLKENFPDYFSQCEKEIAEKLKESYPHSLIIDGVNMIKSGGEVTHKPLLRWCSKNKNNKSQVANTTPVDSIVDDDSPEEVDESSSDSGEPISIFKLGAFLGEIYQLSKHKIQEEREFYNNFKLNEPNLIFVPNNLLYESVLFLYRKSPKLPLPYYSEVLLCSGFTTIEEVDIFWRRALNKSEHNHFYIFCLVGIDKLSYQVADQAVKLLRKYLQLETNDNFKLVIICCEEKKDQSYMAAALENFERLSHIKDIDSLGDIHTYLYQKFTQCAVTSNNEKYCWMVDKEKSRVRLVVSDSVGAGKSLYINNLKSELLSQGIVSEEEREQSAVTVAIHGKQASEEHLAQQLLKRSVSGIKHGVMYHVDIASTVQLCLEPILFKLLILGGICKRSGELWHCRGRDYYVIEITINPRCEQMIKFSQLFPTIKCIQRYKAPNITFVDEKGKMHFKDQIYLSKEEFRRTYAYLSQLETSKDIDTFNFDNATFPNIEESDMSRILLKYCGIKQPSWTEMNNFVMFLSKQLSDCDNSSFCNPKLLGDELGGFKSFVVKFMIHMSQDFATPSLREVDNVTDTLLQIHEIVERRKWENSSHPYIFFNPDRHTMTFLGFHVSYFGDLCDSEHTYNIIEAKIMNRNLLIQLEHNHVNLNEGYQQLDRTQKIDKLAKVMDLNSFKDPNPGYVLTLDNIRKILAILMRFRCNIPVVIMGETGCGKTQLIQFMCLLQVSLLKNINNMLILKVHGGTTETDVMRKVEEAEKLAERNYLEHKIDTVLFFDEANTSPAIGLIKEIMCDRRMYGRHIRTDIGLQFIAACNPYRKHSEEMLNKLSSAGLGFFTKASETTDRLGDIPLRELVYRVMELPASLRPLVWDFGQLSNSIEKTYTREIVAKHLRDRNSPIEARDDIVDVISDVLASAQNYMRERKDECSFVSLRDVERAMRVMLWFYGVLKYLTRNEFGESTSPANDNIQSIKILDSTPSDLSNQTRSVSSVLSHAQRRYPLRLPKVPTVLQEPPPVFLDQSISSLTSTMSHQIYCSEPTDSSNENGLNKISYSLILALAVCYRARLQSRMRFDITISMHFRHPLTPLMGDYSLIDNEIDKCQQNLLDQMTVSEHIAKNKALRENVFMMFVCIELKIPLFLIGKPGSSKSLAKSIISNNMQGNKCQDSSMLRNFKAVHIMSYQCSQLSTAEGITGVFKSCRKMQKQTHSSNFVSCVVLDEVGLAEDSPLLPLKVLHPLLEDSSYEFENKSENAEKRITNSTNSHTTSIGTTHGDNNKVISNTEDQVAFIGISNWSLDPAKMNRGIMVTRGDPDEQELQCSAKEICHSESIDSSFLKSIERWIPILAKAYLKFVKITDTSREYHGLRDFYSLIKMLVFLCGKYKTTLTEAILTHSILRNFGGSSNKQLLNIFMQKVRLPSNNSDGPDNSPMGLIRANLSSSSSSFHEETRYLLLLTENYAALDILLKSSNLWPGNTSDHVRVLFGSHFPRDQDYSKACSNINKIKFCMETGKTVILLHLELLYESLYDTLNQYYMKISDRRYIDLGLGTHRMKCLVHNEFKLIVIAEKDTVYNTFPTPLINRLEKHLLTMPMVLSEEEVKISGKLAKWTKDFSNVVKTNSAGFKIVECFSEGDCFIGYHSDTPYTIVFNVIKQMCIESDQLLDQETALEKSQTLLLKMATTDAVLRLKKSVLFKSAGNIQKAYFELHQGSLEEYLKHVLETIFDNSYTLATTHSRILTDRDVERLTKNVSTDGLTVDISCLSLQLFQTEHEFTKEIQRFLSARPQTMPTGTALDKVLLVQCERGAENAKLIACARQKTVDELKDWREEGNRNSNCKVCVVFLVPLHRESHGSKFVNLFGGSWNTVHIDDIRSVDYEELPPISQLIGKHIYQLFGDLNLESGITFTPSIIWKSRFKHCIHPAISRLVDSNGSEERAQIRLQQFVEQCDLNGPFYKTICERLTTLLKEQSECSPNTSCDWLLKIAECERDIQPSGTFRKAVNLHINSAIIPLLSELLARLDRNGNLELSALDHSLYDIWQDIFRNEELFTLSYKDTISPTTQLPRRRVPILSDGPGGKFFQVEFPFSFLIQEFMNKLWQNFMEIKGNKSDKPHWYIFEKQYFAGTPLVEIINNNLRTNVTNHNSILCYLKDFLQMNVNLETKEQYEVYKFVILSCIESFTPVEEGEQHNLYREKLTIPKIHCSYNDSRQLLNLLQQAFEMEESLGKFLLGKISKLRKDNKNIIFVELVLLEEIIELCYHRKERTAEENLAEKYVTEIRRWESIVQEGFLILDRRGDKTVFNTIQTKWHRIIALQLFISHCSLGESDEYTDFSVGLFKSILAETHDFTSVETFEDVLILLSEFFKKYPILQRQHGATSCFTNIFTNITFKYGDKLNAKLITYLVKLITINESNMQELENNQNSINLFDDSGEEKPSLSFKTYLLQLIIKHRKDVLQVLFSEYFADINPNTVIMQDLRKELHTIFIETIENSIHQSFNLKSDEEQCVQLETILRNEEDISSPGIYGTMENNKLSYELLERIVNLRFVCRHLSHWLIECYGLRQMDRRISNQTMKKRHELIFCLHKLCLKPGYEALHLFLLKNIYHELGTDALQLIISNKISWILLDPNTGNMVKSLSPDYFVIYGNKYELLKHSAEQAHNTKTKAPLQEYFDCLLPAPMEKSANTKFLLFSIFQIVTDSKDVTAQSEGLHAFRDFINTNLVNINEELSQIGLQMLSNNLSNGRIPCFDPDSNNNQIALARLIYHMSVMLASSSYPKLFEPISRIYEDPPSLEDKFFPTITEENPSSARRAMEREEAGKWFVCKGGHPYFIGKSTDNPPHAQICFDCGVVTRDKEPYVNAIRTDTTGKGYIIGSLEQRKRNPCPQRSLSPASLTIIRAFINISFIWSSCSRHPTDRSQVLPSLVKGGLEDSRYLSAFFYQHLERDMWDLAGLTGKNFEEATFLLHLVIKSLMQTAGEPCGIPTELTQRELREQWEKEFDKKFIQPILTSLHTDVQKQMEQVLSEKRIANNPLLRAVHMREEPNNPMPNLWRYRSPLSLEHFAQSFGMAEPAIREKCPLIEMFLKEKSSLFVTRFLPDIVELQLRLGERFQHRLSKREASNTTIEGFLNNMEREEEYEFEKLIHILINAWNIIGDKVKTDGRLRMQDTLEQQITPATSLAYLLASSTGEGLLITSLTDYLVLVHNSFVHAYRDRVKGSRSDKVPLRELKARHVIEYEEQLQPLLLSHAHYSLALGQGSHVSYDFEGVEKQLAEQFIQSRPLILAQHLRFEYTREAYNLGVFEQVRHKVQQSNLRETLWRPIQEDLDSLEVLSDVLLVVEVVIAFLSERGGNPEQRISSYLHDILEYPLVTHGAGPLQSKSAEEVLLAHVLSFWRFLSIEKTRKLSILGQALPFSSLDDKFQGAVSEEEMKQIKHSCDFFPVEKILAHLHEFIIFYLGETGAVNVELGLKKSFEEYAVKKGWKLHHGFSQRFPEGIKLSQCNAAWAILANQEHQISKI